MAGFLSSLFGGKYPSTAKYERNTQKRAADFKKYQEFATSAAFRRYTELDELVHTGEFEKRVHILKNEKFKNTEAFKKWQDYKTLLNNTELKHYLYFIKSGKASNVEQTGQSASFRKYQELSVLVSTSAFESLKKQKGFKKTEEYRQLQEYKKLKSSSGIKFYNKATNSIEYKNYKSMLNSERLTKFETLQKYVNSSEFADYKREIEDPKRFKNSEEYQLLKEFDTLSKNTELTWYLKMKSQNAFSQDARWTPTFDEDFDRSQLNGNKWITGYYWGKALLNDSYVLAHEQQWFKPENIDIRESVAHLNTRPEQCNGKVWDAARGFITATFDHSAALISTGQSFRQLYGRFEAKVKLSHDQPMTHNFWMVAENRAPQIDVFKYGNGNKKNITSGINILKNNTVQQLTKNINGDNFSSDYFIYSLEWTPKKMTWRINGVEVHTETANIPDQPMYMVFSSNMHKKPSKEVRSTMSIDWVRCFQLTE